MKRCRLQSGCHCGPVVKAGYCAEHLASQIAWAKRVWADEMAHAAAVAHDLAVINAQKAKR